MDPDVTLASQDAVLMIAKAAVSSTARVPFVCQFTWILLKKQPEAKM